MSILVDRTTKVIIQSMTCETGTCHTQQGARLMRRLALLALASVLPVTAAVSAPWIDDKGRFLVMQFPDAPVDNLTPKDHDIASAAAMFKNLCLDTGLDRDAAGKKAEAAGWGFAYRPSIVPFKDPVDIGGWVAADAALNVGKGLFFNKHAQCGLTVAVTGPSDAAAAEAAMVAVVGSQPGNAAKALDSKGQRKKFYEPEWAVTDPSGAVIVIFVHSLTSTSGQVQFAALRKASK